MKTTEILKVWHEVDQLIRKKLGQMEEKGCPCDCHCCARCRCAEIKATPAPQKCDHSDFNAGDHCTICRPGFTMDNPSSTVEEKIKDICMNPAWLNDKLHELVALAKVER